MWLLDARSVCNWLAVWHTEDIRWEPEFWMGCRGSPLRLCHCCCTIILLRMLSAPFNKFTLQIRKCVISDSSVGNIYHLLPLVIAAACKLQVEQKKNFFLHFRNLVTENFLEISWCNLKATWPIPVSHMNEYLPALSSNQDTLDQKHWLRRGCWRGRSIQEL